MRHLRHLAVATILAAAGGLLLAGGAWAQAVTTAAVQGTVTGEDGRPLVGAQVSVRDLRTGATTGALTNASGRYFIPHLQVGGPYVVSVRLIGYQPEAREDVHLSLGQTVSLDFELEERAVEVEELTISVATDAIFGATRTGQATTIGEAEIVNLPTLTRNFADFATLSPLASVEPGGVSMSFAGQNNRFNNIQIDGAVNNDLFGLAASGVPGGQANAKPISLEAIQEFQVLIAPFDVRQSGFSGGQINAVTRAGTNQFRGSAFGFFTNNDLIGDLDGAAFGEFDNTQFGFSLGGPIVHDRIHFFTANEFERETAPNPGPAIGAAAAGETGIHPDSAARLASIASGVYGLDPGEFGAFSVGNPRTNLFGRVDWQLGDDHRLSVRHNLNRAVQDNTASRGGFNYEFSSSTYEFTSVTNTTVAELFSRLGARWHNELLVGATFVRDNRDPLVDYPFIEVGVTSDLDDGSSVDRQMRIGAERFSHANALDQNIFQLTNNLTGTFGNHRITLGTSNELFSFTNTFLPLSLGTYRFASLEDFEANNPSRYEIQIPFPGLTQDDVIADWGVFRLGLYAQDEWQVTDELNLTFGLRIDVPFFLDEPRENPDFAAAFGASTATTPSGNIHWAPRFGFNWQPELDRQTQVRGGVGIFTGRPPFVWVSNAFTNTGRELVTLVCTGDDAPGLTPGGAPPTTCLDGSGPEAGGVMIVNYFDEGFRFPQELKANLGIDRELFAGITGTLEGILTKSMNQIFIEEVNLAGPQTDVGSRQGIGDRPIFGTATESGFSPVRVSEDFGAVLLHRNTSDNIAYAATLELQRAFADRYSLRGSYTLSRAEDTQSLTSSIATSNFGFMPVEGDPNNPPRALSTFDRPHRVVLSGTARVAEFGPRREDGRRLATEVSVFYVGQSGTPYAYVYGSDINGDGYPGPGVVSGRINDLVYVPTGPGDKIFESPADAQLYEDLINEYDCLSAQRGQIMQRNSCRNPWTNRLDMRVVQGLPVGPGNLKATLDMFNFMNLLNSDWGRVERAPFSGIQLLNLAPEARVGGDPEAPLQFRYVGPTRDADGNLDPFTTFSPASQWQLKLGLRYEF